MKQQLASRVIVESAQNEGKEGLKPPSPAMAP